MTQENISCKKATALMSKSLERQLSIKEKAALMAHLAICKTCVFCFNQIKIIRKTLALYPDSLTTIMNPRKYSLSLRAKQRIKNDLNSLSE
ncbi:MAG: zf-HC2 domain-containing protein [Candidatus Omnitrophota bacterium]